LFLSLAGASVSVMNMQAVKITHRIGSKIGEPTDHRSRHEPSGSAAFSKLKTPAAFLLWGNAATNDGAQWSRW